MNLCSWYFLLFFLLTGLIPSRCPSFIAIGVPNGSAKDKPRLCVCSLLGPGQHRLVRNCFRVTGRAASDLSGALERYLETGVSLQATGDSTDWIARVRLTSLEGVLWCRVQVPVLGPGNSCSQLPEVRRHSTVLPRK